MKIYQLNGFPEEVISHAFAKTSRSNGTFSEMITKLDADKSSKFHEKWVLDYAHSSVSEHSVAHIAVEGVSRAVVEEIESGRLASYTEQSTRYQKLGRETVYFNDNWHANFKNDYNQAMNLLYGLYDELLLCNTNGKANYDVARFVLPLGATANLGATLNMRSLRRTICKLLASNLPEAQEVAEQLITIGSEVAPTLLKHISPCNSTKIIKAAKIRLGCHADTNYNSPIEVKLEKSEVSFQEILQRLAVLAGGQFGDTISATDYFSIMSNLEPHDSLSRALEYGRLEFIITSDYGSYYDMKRHRMATIIPEQGFTLSFVKPSELQDPMNYLCKRYISVMQQVKEIYLRHYGNPEAIYMLPNATLKTYSMSVNPRELAEIVRLRGFNPDGHPTYRAIGLQMYEKTIAQYPFLDWLDNKRKDKATSESIINGYQLIK